MSSFPSGLAHRLGDTLNSTAEIAQASPAAGIEAIAATMGQERDTLEDVVEPYLLQIGFVIRTRQGRQVTREACRHLGLPFEDADHPKPADQRTLF